MLDDPRPENEPAVLVFEGGIPGFGAHRQFLLADLTDEGTFQELVCVDEPGLALVVASPWWFFPEYRPDLPEQDRAELAIGSPVDAAVFCAVVVDDDQLMMNLRAPFVVHASTHRARQVILDEDQPMRAPVLTAT